MEKKALYYSSIAILLLLMTFSCKKMDRTYKQFIVPGGLTYPEKATTPLAYAGRGRVKITWLRGTDPSVTYAKVFWNNYTDSVKVEIPAHSHKGDTISAIINNLPEKSYTFIIKTFDSAGHSSVAAELITATYGDKYQASLLNRPVKNAILKGNGDVIINWGSADISNGAIASEVKYIDTMGKDRTEFLPVKDSTSVIHGVKSGNPFQFRTVFIPDSLSIDTFNTAYQKDTLLLLDKANWQVIDFSTEYPGREDTKVGRIIDGDPTTRWHSNKGHSTRADFVTVDMKAERTITYFELWRDDGDDRACDSFQLFVSRDNLTWDSLGGFHFDRFTDAGQMYEISSHPEARYWKFVGLPGPENYQVMGEISVYGF